MGKILNCKEAAAAIKDKVKQDCEMLKQQGIQPKLAVLRVGSKPEDIAYEKGIIRVCKEVGAEAEIVELPEAINMMDFIEALEKVNNSETIHGIMVFRPLPGQLDENYISTRINAEKDIDCMNPTNMVKIYQGSAEGFIPCTAKAVMDILDYFGVNAAGRNVAIAGRSMVVGKPLSMLMLGRNATVTVCHSKTADIAKTASDADILITAVGKARFFGSSCVKEGAVVIDVGINSDANGNLCGDVDFDAVVDKAGMITPVPGGVGSVTSAVLAKQLIAAAKSLSGK